MIQKGFTLIELLIVILIIGLLATITFMVLNDSRNKGNDANITSNIMNVRAHAEYYWDVNNRTYGALCSDATILLASTSVAQARGAMQCVSNVTQFRISSPLVRSPGTFFCIDNNGFSGVVNVRPTTFLCQ